MAQALWEELGIGEVLQGLEPRGTASCARELALFTMVANRLAEPYPNWPLAMSTG